MLVHEQLRRFEGSIVAATRNGLNSVDLDHSTRWSFSEALLYSVTVITTIGHGNLTPKTSGGKVVTIIYALIGVPLMLMCLSNLGGLLADLLQCTYTRLCCTRTRYGRELMNDEKCNHHHHLQYQQHHHHHHHHHHLHNQHQNPNPNQNHSSCEGQSYEMDCNICKYDAVSNETKLHGYEYTALSDREDSCQLIHNSPSKLNHHMSSPCMQIKTATYPIIKPYNNLKSLPSSVETSPIKQHLHHQQHQQRHNDTNQLNPPQYYPMTTLNYRNSINNSSISSCRAPIPSSPPSLPSSLTTTTTNNNTTSTVDDNNSHTITNNNCGQQLLTSNLNSTTAGAATTTTATVYFPITSSTGNHFSCTSAIHYGNQPIVKYHTISLHPSHSPHQQQQQHQQHQLMNSPTKVMTTSNHPPPHIATVHGIRRGKFIPKPMPQEINMLLAENSGISTTSSIVNMGNTTSTVGGGGSGVSDSSITSFRQQQQHQQQYQQHQQHDSIVNCNELQSTNNLQNDNLPVVDIMEDEEEHEQNRIGCPHGTPSRVPLISSSRKTLNSTDIEQDTDKEDNDSKNLKDNQHNKKIKTSTSTTTTTSNKLSAAAAATTATTATTSTAVQVPITIVLLILIVYICFGTIIFAFWENWSFIDGAYFCFVTLSTIGYGDFIPHKTFNNGPNIQLFLCCAYLLIGLVLVAMSFSVLETQLMWKCRKIAVRLKLAKD